MKLFFETSGQASAFLLTVPLGFLLAFFLDTHHSFSMFRMWADLSVILLTGILILILLLYSNSAFFRLYHMLGILIGTILYTEGLHQLRKRYRRNKRKAQEGDSVFYDEYK